MAQLFLQDRRARDLGAELGVGETGGEGKCRAPQGQPDCGIT
jgi:hypothetical protein